MRIACIGAGGAGGLLGAKLGGSGNDVCFLVRGDNLRALQSRGLILKSICGDVNIPPPVAAAAVGSDLGPMDVVIVATKAGDVAGVIPDIREMLQPSTIVVTIQNGIQSPEALESAVGRDRVYGGVSRFISIRTRPGVINHIGVPPSLLLGPFDVTGSRFERVAAEFSGELTKAGIASRIVADIHRALWEKVVLVTCLSVVGSLARVPIGEFRGCADTRSVMSQIMSEVIEIANRVGVEISVDCIAETLRFIDAMSPESTASMQRDIAEGKPSEVEVILGELKRLAGRHQVKTPCLDFGYAMLLPAELKARRSYDRT
jgi:2-dehydropantoate 2-reductase